MVLLHLRYISNDNESFPVCAEFCISSVTDKTLPNFIIYISNNTMSYKKHSIFILSVFVMCAWGCQFLSIVHSGLSLWFSGFF